MIFFINEINRKDLLGAVHRINTKRRVEEGGDLHQPSA